MQPMRLVFLVTTLAFISLAGCAALQPEPPRSPASEGRSCCRTTTPATNRAAIAQTAAKLVGLRSIEHNGRRIGYDCAGVTRAIFLEHGIDLYGTGAQDLKANGVRLIYTHARQHGTLHQGPVANPGDLVFFDNTWDYNGDGKINDPLTHVGIVERQEPNGTVIFISRVSGAIERYRMNTALPHVHTTMDGRVLNDYLRRKDITDFPDTAHLAGELFTTFATLIEH